MAVGSPAARRVRPARPVVRVAALAVVATLAACSSSSGGGTTSPSTAGATQAAVVSPTATPTPTAPAPVLAVVGGPTVAYGKPVTVSVQGGTFSAVTVTTKAGDALDGQIGLDGVSWVSLEPPKPATDYVVQATVKDGVGTNQDTSAAFAVTPVPSDKKLSYTVSPADGSTVGIGQPVIVRFLTPVTEKAAVEKHMLVDAKTSAGAAVEGSWHWLGSQQADWRPKQFWTPGTKVTVDLRLAGVKASKTRFGRKDYKQTFTIGASHVLKVDLSALKARLYHDGKLIDTWAAGGGKRGLETYSGTYVVLDKSKVIEMDSCSAGITCDKKNPDYYSGPEYWATRLTRSGTFVHAADWDGALGRANTSHGCIHLSGAHAKAFFAQANPGDVVIVSNSGRGPQERINTGDPGLYPWNISWAAWVKGSALS